MKYHVVRSIRRKGRRIPLFLKVRRSPGIIPFSRSRYCSSYCRYGTSRGLGVGAVTTPGLESIFVC
jgi:hypothetical protein